MKVKLVQRSFNGDAKDFVFVGGGGGGCSWVVTFGNMSTNSQVSIESR